MFILKLFQIHGKFFLWLEFQTLKWLIQHKEEKLFKFGGPEKKETKTKNGIKIEIDE